MNTSLLSCFDRSVYQSLGITTKRWNNFHNIIDEIFCDLNGRHIGEIWGDGNVYDHQLRQARQIRKYGILNIDSQALVTAHILEDTPLSKEEFFQLRVCNLIHDMGETLSARGDIAWTEKKLGHQKKKKLGN